MLLLGQGVTGMRKDGESAVWNHHKQSFRGESLTVNACPQLVTLMQVSDAVIRIPLTKLYKPSINR